MGNCVTLNYPPNRSLGSSAVYAILYCRPWVRDWLATASHEYHCKHWDLSSVSLVDWMIPILPYRHTSSRLFSKEELPVHCKASGKILKVLQPKCTDRYILLTLWSFSLFVHVHMNVSRPGQGRAGADEKTGAKPLTRSFNLTSLSLAFARLYD